MITSSPAPNSASSVTRVWRLSCHVYCRMQARLSSCRALPGGSSANRRKGPPESPVPRSPRHLTENALCADLRAMWLSKVVGVRSRARSTRQPLRPCMSARQELLHTPQRRAHRLRLAPLPPSQRTRVHTQPPCGTLLRLPPASCTDAPAACPESSPRGAGCSRRAGRWPAWGRSAP
jgi:hypothetical protein